MPRRHRRRDAGTNRKSYGPATPAIDDGLASLIARAIATRGPATNSGLDNARKDVTQAEKKATEHSQDDDTARLKNLEWDEKSLNNELAQLEEPIQPILFSSFIGLIVAGVLGLIIYPVTIVLGMYAWRQGRRYKRFKARPNHVGLYYVCHDFLELIKYQTTLFAGKELGATYSFLSGKLTSNKQLSDRPLSLPGLTANCSAVLKNIAEVFEQKVVICIDKLDKITDTAQLTELLKGIKGILGQENTHFLLTLSEDAMSHFSERLSSERNLIESSFEEVVYLDRVDRSTAAEIVRRSLAQGDSLGAGKFSGCRRASHSDDTSNAARRGEVGRLIAERRGPLTREIAALAIRHERRLRQRHAQSSVLHVVALSDRQSMKFVSATR